MKNFKITPSIYCANTCDLKTEINNLIKAGINHIHFDVMDGHFVNNYGLSPKQLDDIKKEYPNLIIDVHIMATNNFFHNLELFKQANYLTFHINTIWASNWIEYINTIKQLGLKVGIALDLKINFEEIESILPLIDLVTIMSIQPGFTGQSFEESAWKKIAQIKNLKKEYPNLKFQIDGGVRWNNIKRLIDNDLDYIVVGSMLFSEPDYLVFMKKIKLLTH